MNGQDINLTVVELCVGCDCVGGVVDSGTCCVILLLDSLHQRLLQSSRRAQFVGKKNKNLDIGLYWLISVFGPGQVSVVGLADNPPPEFAEDQPKKTRKPTGTYFLKFFKVRGHPKVAPHPRTHAGAALRQITMHISTNDLY